MNKVIKLLSISLFSLLISSCTTTNCNNSNKSDYTDTINISFNKGILKFNGTNSFKFNLKEETYLVSYNAYLLDKDNNKLGLISDNKLIDKYLKEDMEIYGGFIYKLEQSKIVYFSNDVSYLKLID